MDSLEPGRLVGLSALTRLLIGETVYSDNKNYMTFKFNYDRYSKWVAASMSWVRNDPDTVTFTRIQGLGIIDAELYDINKHDIDKLLDNHLTVYDHVNIKSYLWVLGVYELFRMMDQKIRQQPEITDDNASLTINNAKKEFERVRVPLAKLEKAYRFKNDFSVPKLGADEEQLGWQMNENEIIRYRDLSDLAIGTLNQLRLSNYKKNGLFKDEQADS